MSNWSVDGTQLALSISKNGNLIVSSFDPTNVFEYTSDGTFVREILVDRFVADIVIGLTHAIQLEEDKFVICQTMLGDSDTPNRVCIIDTTGRVIKCYGGNKGSGIGHLNGPVYLTIDRNGSILVADMKNDRIVQLNATLEYMNEFTSLKQPIIMRPNEVCGGLYVMETYDQSITFLDI